MWSKKPMPVAICDAPVPSRFTATSTSVSLVFRCTAPLRIHLPREAHDPEKWIPVFGQDHAQEKSRAFYQGFIACATTALACSVALRLVWVNGFAGSAHDPVGERAGGLVQRRVHAGARGAH